MIPTDTLSVAMLDAAAADATTLAPAMNANHVHLIAEDFVPGGDTDFTTLTAASFNGSTPINVELGAQQVGNDPLTGQRFIQLVPPVGGWYWECAVAPATPETIYGYVVTDNADAVTLGSGKLDQPVTISAVGNSIILPEIRLTEALGAFS